MPLIRSASLVAVASLLLTFLFWGPLWLGYGFIGGDLYPYFFPQKAFLADRLHAGEFPLWNNLTGFGYPILGESQTGAAYPLHILAYYLLDVNTAYNVEHLVHYFICFVGIFLFASRLRLGFGGALLTAVVFTYGWFPPRACLEWAIVTGAWLPVCLWCVESFVQTGRWRFAIGLSIALGLQLLAGHFHLAFITQLTVVAYGAWRIWMSRADLHLQKSPSDFQGGVSHRDTSFALGRFVPASAGLILAIIAGFMLASVQLLPAWELKTRSSRAVVGREHEPSYGHLPPLYATQMFAPWLWYSPHRIQGDDELRSIFELGAPWHWFGPDKDVDESLMQARAGGLTTIDTNKVEAHLYCGLVPLALAIWWVVAGRKRTALLSGGRELPGSSRQKTVLQTTVQPGGSRPPLRDEQTQERAGWYRAETWFWVICGAAALIYATGWLLPVARYLPGFNFFRGPGRYGIVTTLAVSVLAGRGLDQMISGRKTVGRVLVVGLVFWSTICDLWMVSRMLTYAVMVSHPAISYREQSPIRTMLRKEHSAVRLYAPGQNVCNLLGVSCLPVYLGIAPTEYSDPKFAGQGMPKPTDDLRPVLADEEFSNWLVACGVTHVLAFYPLDESSWQANLIWQGIDPMLNRAWGRSEPLFLYKLRMDSGPVSILEGETTPSDAVINVPFQDDANRRSFEVESSTGVIAVLEELAYPGWGVTVDDAPAAVSSISAAVPDLARFREVDVPLGHHKITWIYRPWSVRAGAMISLATLFVLAAIGHVRFWHRERLNRLLNLCRLTHVGSDDRAGPLQ